MEVMETDYKNIEKNKQHHFHRFERALTTRRDLDIEEGGGTLGLKVNMKLFCVLSESVRNVVSKQQ